MSISAVIFENFFLISLRSTNSNFEKRHITLLIKFINKWLMEHSDPFHLVTAAHINSKYSLISFKFRNGIVYRRNLKGFEMRFQSCFSSSITGVKHILLFCVCINDIFISIYFNDKSFLYCKAL